MSFSIQLGEIHSCPASPAMYIFAPSVRPPFAYSGSGWLAMTAICAAPIIPAIIDNGIFGRAWAIAAAVLIIAEKIDCALSRFACFLAISVFFFSKSASSWEVRALYCSWLIFPALSCLLSSSFFRLQLLSYSCSSFFSLLAWIWLNCPQISANWPANWIAFPIFPSRSSQSSGDIPNISCGSSSSFMEANSSSIFSFKAKVSIPYCSASAINSAYFCLTLAFSRSEEDIKAWLIRSCAAMDALTSFSSSLSIMASIFSEYALYTSIVSIPNCWQRAISSLYCCWVCKISFSDSVRFSR